MTTKVPLLLFSGGVDSTYLLWHLLQQSEVDVLYIDGGQHPLKRAAEERARAKILAVLDRMDLPFKVGHSIVDDEKLYVSGKFIEFQQLMPWLFGAMRHLNPFRHSSVQVAYVMGDDIMTHRRTIQEIWDKMLEVLISDATAPLQVPLHLTRKDTILELMPAELRELVWVCETPCGTEDTEITQCGQCISCTRLRETLARIEPKSPGYAYNDLLVQTN